MIAIGRIVFYGAFACAGWFIAPYLIERAGQKELSSFFGSVGFVLAALQAFSLQLLTRLGDSGKVALPGANARRTVRRLAKSRQHAIVMRVFIGFLGAVALILISLLLRIELPTGTIRWLVAAGAADFLVLVVFVVLLLIEYRAVLELEREIGRRSNLAAVNDAALADLRFSKESLDDEAKSSEGKD